MVKLAVLSRSQFFDLLKMMAVFAAGREDEFGFWIDDDGLKVKAGNLSWSMPFGKVVTRDR